MGGGQSTNLLSTVVPSCLRLDTFWLFLLFVVCCRLWLFVMSVVACCGCRWLWFLACSSVYWLLLLLLFALLVDTQVVMLLYTTAVSEEACLKHDPATLSYCTYMYQPTILAVL